MLIGVRKRFVYAANTKTASTSIEFALSAHAEIICGGGPARKHMSLGGVEKEYWFVFQNPKLNFESFFRFGVMREPISWINSWYRYRRENKVASPLPATMSFEDFWRARDWNIQSAAGKRYLQSTVFTNTQNKILADVIIPYERMNDFLPEIMKLLKIDYSLPHKNASKLKESEAPLPESLIAEMREFYEPDYQIYNALDELNAVGMDKLRKMTESK